MHDSSTAYDSRLTRRITARFAGAWTIAALAILLLSTPSLTADRYSEVAARIRALEAAPSARVLSLGRSGSGRQIYGVLLSDPKRTRAADTRIVVLSGQHGNEVSPVLAMMNLAEDMAAARDPRLTALMRDTALVLVPVVNPDGFASNHRLNSRKTDLNRDWNPASQPESRSVQSLVDGFRPQVVVDLHEWMDRNPLHTNCVEVSGFGRGPQRKLSRLLSALARHEIAKHTDVTGEVRSVFYRKDADTRLAHRHFANQGICSMLVETASDQSRDLRMRVYREFVLATVRTLGNSGDPRVMAEMTALSQSIGDPDPKFAHVRAPRVVAATGVGDLSCWIVIAAATIYIVMRSLGAKNKRTSDGLILGRSGGIHPQICRMPLTEVVRVNLPVHARVALIQQQRVRPSDRGKSAVGTGKAA